MSGELTTKHREYVIRRLEAWADWSARLEVSGLGFHRRVNWIKDHRRGGNPESTPPILDSDERAMLTERCVVNLPIVMRQVVIAEYLKQSSRKDKAAQCGCTPQTFKKRLERAHAYIYPDLRSKH